MVMRRFGRRNGYIFGGLHGVVGGSIAALAIVWGDFVMFCIGTLIAGFYGSYVQSYRFAATDSATPAFRARAISYVLAGGLAAGILGPQVVIFTRDMVPGATFCRFLHGTGDAGPDRHHGNFRFCARRPFR